MSSFVFNDFKKRYLEGNVPSADTWTFIPVADSFKQTFEFDDIRLDHYRTIMDFKNVADKRNPNSFDIVGNYINPHQFGKEEYIRIDDATRIKGDTLVDGVPLTFTWTKVLDDDELNNKPMYVTKDNFNNFKNYYSATVANNPYIDQYLNSGFYFIRSKDELEWFAERVNQNDKIIGVIGDNFEGVISKPIGYDEKHPFNGILDGNYFTFDITVKAQYTDNGVIGVLGSQGIARNFVLKHSDFNRISIDCEKPINLTHIKNDGRDINCGLLVGRNYGKIENIDAKNLGSFMIYGCVPSVYSVTNKSDSYKWNETEKIVRKKFDTNNENFMYLNSFCINSPGNICPYVGYFNEGKFADDRLGLCVDTNQTAMDFSVTGQSFYAMFFANGYASWKNSTAYKENNIDWSIRCGSPNSLDLYQLGTMKQYNGSYVGVNTTRNIASNTYNYDLDNNYEAAAIIRNPLYYGVDNYGYFTVRAVGKLDNPQTWVENFNSNLCQKVLGNSGYRDCSALEPEYEMTRVSMRPQPNARAAYNVGTIIGANYGTAINIQVSAIVQNTSNFVGFIGGLAGKQANGYIDQVSVYMDNQLKYDLESKPENGDVVYYKQTPVFSEPVKQYIQGALANYSDNDTGKKNLLSMYCEAWYDETRPDAASLDYTVNTATTVTNDVISYKLRPIFVVGGMFGRYIPTYGVNEYYQNMVCVVNNSTVLYKDNYDSTENFKRPENAFGALIGKVDYATTNNSIYFFNSLAFNNCQISALSNVGEPFRYFANHFDENDGWVPDVIDLKDTGDYRSAFSALNSGICTKKYVGIYEIKNNVIEGVSYTVNSSATALYEGATNKSKQSLSNLGIYWGTDYPIELSAHNGGITQSHEMYQFIPDLLTNNDYRWSNNGGYWGPYDILHQDFYYPNYDAANRFGGYNKRNMASKLIVMNGCYSNVDNWIELYDDYINQWHYMQLPPTSTDLSPDHLSGNYFNAKELYLIKKYWNRVGTHYGYTSNTEVSSYLKWDTASADLYSANSGLYLEGLVQDQVDRFIANGTQNTYDGYTTVINVPDGWYNGNQGYIDSPNNANTTAFEYYQLNCYDINTRQYNTPKRFVKNIMKHYNPTWVVNNNASIQWTDKVTFKARNSSDSYFYYTYSATSGKYNQVHTTYNTLENAFAFKLPVTFTASNSMMGYGTDLTLTEQLDQSRLSTISLGEYLSPAAIRENINKYGTFNTTSVSSNMNLGGLLVVDSFGRNVMFLDNDQNAPITGNAISFPALDLRINTKKTKKIILEVE